MCKTRRLLEHTIRLQGVTFIFFYFIHWWSIFWFFIIILWKVDICDVDIKVTSFFDSEWTFGHWLHLNYNLLFGLLFYLIHRQFYWFFSFISIRNCFCFQRIITFITIFGIFTLNCDCCAWAVFLAGFLVTWAIVWIIFSDCYPLIFNSHLSVRRMTFIYSMLMTTARLFF